MKQDFSLTWVKFSLNILCPDGKHVIGRYSDSLMLQNVQRDEIEMIEVHMFEMCMQI